MFIIQLQKVYPDNSKTFAYISVDENLTEHKSHALTIASGKQAKAIAADLQSECNPEDGTVTVRAIRV